MDITASLFFIHTKIRFNFEQPTKFNIHEFGLKRKLTYYTYILQDWYKSWLCLNFWPIYRVGRVLPPCPNQCTTVQTSCPFHTIFEDASMASGDPTFLCQGILLYNCLNNLFILICST